RHLFSLLVLFCLFSCGNTTYNQKVALKKVGDFYGGNISTSTGFNAHNTTKVNYFETKVNNSPLIIEDLQNISLHAGNIAYMIYSNINNKNAYDEYRVNINLPNNESRNNTFVKTQLEQASSLMPTIDNFNSVIIRREYANLDKLLKDRKST